jgi:hypothetical protein
MQGRASRSRLLPYPRIPVHRTGHARVTQHHGEVCPVARGVIWPHGATPIRSMTDRRSRVPRSLTCSPLGSPGGLRSLPGRIFSGGRTTGCPTFRVRTRAGEVSPLRRWRNICAGCVRSAWSCPRACWPQPLSTCGWSCVTTCISDSPRVDPPTRSSCPTASMRAVAAASRDEAAIHKG